MRDVRRWTYAALFGALWGALEVTLGTALHLGRVPLKGLLLGSLGLLCLVAARRLQPRPGVCLLAGLVAAFLKVFALGGLYPGPLIGVLAEAVLVEAAFLATGDRWAGAVAGGALTLALSPVQMVLMTWFVAGADAVEALGRLLQSLAIPAMGVGVEPALLLAALVGSCAALGGVAGGWAWWVAGRVLRRVGR